MLAVFLILERILFLTRWFIDYVLPAKLRIVEIHEKRRDIMVNAYYKLLLEDPDADDPCRGGHSQVEALVPVDPEDCVGEAPHEWQSVEIDQIVRACSEVHPETQEATITISPFQARDPGFEP